MPEKSDSPVVVIERSDGGLAGFLWGAIVGAAVALLFAPQSGEETRREIKNRGRRLRAAAQERAEDLQEVLGERYERTKEWVEEGIDGARESLDEKRGDAREALDAGKSAVRSARTELEQRLSKTRRSRTKARTTSEGASEDDE